MNTPENTETPETPEVREPGRGKTILKRSAITVAVLTGIGAAATIGLSLMSTVPDSGENRENIQVHSEGEGWANDFSTVDRVVTTDEVVAVKHGGAVSFHQTVDGELLETLDVGSDNHRVVSTQSVLAVFTDEKAWAWTTENGIVEVNVKGFQIRALGQKIFAISDAQDEIKYISEQGELISLDAPTERAVPLTGASDGSIVWATGGNEIIVADSSGEKESQAKLSPTTKDATVARWLGANVSHTFLVWESDGEETLAVHSNTDGSIISFSELENIEEAQWRVTLDQSLGTIESVVVQLYSGSITRFAEPFTDVVALKDTFIGVQGESTFKFDTYHVEEVPSEEGVTTVGETTDGKLIQVQTLNASEGVRLTVGG